MRNILSKLQRDEDGAALAEYGLLGALIAAVAVASVTALGVDINAMYVNITTRLAAALP
jgi:pilus assembly protein Flp/PilA